MICAVFFRVAVRGSSTRLLAGPAVILLSTLPLSTYFYVASNLTAARYLYLASAGWALLVAELLVLLGRRVLVTTAVCALSTALALTLQVNLRPWRVAGRLVAEMQQALGQGRSVDTVLAPLRASPPAGMTFRHSTPYDYQGVGIFINGYPEFLKLETSIDAGH
jgi:hypothetical protein